MIQFIVVQMPFGFTDFSKSKCQRAYIKVTKQQYLPLWLNPMETAHEREREKQIMDLQIMPIQLFWVYTLSIQKLVVTKRSAETISNQEDVGLTETQIFCKIYIG